jgi:hypothetical protein
MASFESAIGKTAKGALEGISNALNEVLKNQNGSSGSPSSAPSGDSGAGRTASAGDVLDFAKGPDIYA